MSFGVFLCPESNSAQVAHSAEAVRSAPAVHPVGPFYLPTVSGHTFHTDQSQNACVGHAHWSTSPSTGSQERGLPITPVADLKNMPDALPVDTVKVPADSFFPEHFCFFNAQGASVGWPVDDYSCDMVLSRCTEWAWEACLDWEMVLEPSFDSQLVQCDTTSIDTGSVTVSDGALSVLSKLVGEIDGSRSLPEDIADLVYMVEWMLEGNPAPRHPLTADCNGDSLVDIAALAFRDDTTSPPD